MSVMDRQQVPEKRLSRLNISNQQVYTYVVRSGCIWRSQPPFFDYASLHAVFYCGRGSVRIAIIVLTGAIMGVGKYHKSYIFLCRRLGPVRELIAWKRSTPSAKSKAPASCLVTKMTNLTATVGMIPIASLSANPPAVVWGRAGYRRCTGTEMNGEGEAKIRRQTQQTPDKYPCPLHSWLSPSASSEVRSNAEVGSKFRKGYMT